MKAIIRIILLICLATSCKREEYSNIPYSPVNLTLYPEDMMQLAGSPSHLSFIRPKNAGDQLGYGGLLVVHGLDYTPSATYYVYDLACPVESQKNIRIQPDDTGLTATCNRCGSVFNIADGGYPQSGTELKLIRYQITPLGNGSYRISH
jgi:hypothetical protein